MRYTIKHEIPGRLRFSFGAPYSEECAVAFEQTLQELPCVTKARAYPKAGHMAVWFEAVPAATFIGEDCQQHARAAVELPQARAAVVAAVRAASWEGLRAWQPTDPFMLAPRSRQLFHQLACMITWHGLRRAFLPAPLRTAWSLVRAVPFWREAARSLRARRLDVPVLDAAAITMGFLMGDNSAGSTMLLLNIGQALEDFTQRRSQSSLARSLLDIPTTARVVVLEGDESRSFDCPVLHDVDRICALHERKIAEEAEVDISQLHRGSIVVVRMGGAIPADGVVLDGSAEVNQCSLTGESMPVTRRAGDSVFAGTAVEDGEIFIGIGEDPANSKVRSIVSMVERSNSAKSAEQVRIEAAAEKLVPYNFALAGVVGLATRNLEKTASTLMVDYSCALKLSGSIAVMSAQREGAQRGAMVKGSLYFQRMAEADTIVFDKTGTLTAATPRVSHIHAFGGYSREDVLSLAACLEEHFPHPVARAVVNAAFDEGLKHREMHTEVEYIVAHGIVSSLDGQRVVIGSHHFVVEDEGILIPDDEQKRIYDLAETSSPLFLGVDGKLRGVLFIDDPIRESVPFTISELRTLGFKRVIMLTGDNNKTASHIAKQAGIDEFHANLLPEDKLRIVNEIQSEGHKVCMVGDGVNDSPALAAAHVSVAMSGSSAIARETADISLVSDDAHALVDLRKLSEILAKRMRHGYTFTVAFNSLLLALGIAGVLTPQTSSLLHNGSTVAVSAIGARKFLPSPNETQAN